MVDRGIQSYVRGELLPARPAPIFYNGILGWLRENLFSSVLDSLMSLLFLVLLFTLLPPLVNWIFWDASWFGVDRSACTTVSQGGVQPDGWSGMCWPFITSKINFFIYGYFPAAEQWRANLVFFLFSVLLVLLAIPRVPYKGYNAFLLCIVFPIVAFFLLCGNQILGLDPIPTEKWGGLLVTLVISFVGILIAFPLGIFLALGRRSEIPVLRLLSVIFIEFVRGVPLITVLFVANVLLPLFLPSDITIDQLTRVLVGVGLFTSAYVAEVLRGGLQGVHKGQYEGAYSVGLGSFHTMSLIVLPQALRISIPGLVGTFISLFKDTTLVYTISMLDLLGIVRQHFADTDWISPQTAVSGLLFAGAVFWFFCFSVSRYSIFMENYLRTGHR